MFKDQIILDTYNLYYGDKLVKSTINTIQQLFKKTFSMHIKDIMRHFGDLSFILLIRSLKFIVQNNIPVINKYGFVCFLKYERNIFFLTDNIQSVQSYFVNYYCRNPPVYSTNNFKSIILENQSNNIEKIIKHINSLDLDNDEDLKIASDLLFELNNDLQEQIIEYSILSRLLQPDKTQPVRDLCLKLFNPNIIELSDMFVSIHLIETYRYRFLPKTAKGIDEWEDINDEILIRLKEKEEEKVEEIKYIKDNPFGFYGIITKDQKFKIKQTEKSIVSEKGIKIMKEGKEEIDKRKRGEGAVCSTMTPVSKILDVIIKISNKTDYFNIPKDTELPSKKIMKSLLINKAKYNDEDIKKLDINELNIAYYWLDWYNNNSKAKLCNEIKTFFEKNNIIEYEK